MVPGPPVLGSVVIVAPQHYEGYQMDEVRSEKVTRIIRNRWTADDTEVDEKDVTHFLTNTGGIVSFETHRTVTCDCGCVARPGGICAVCHEAGKSGVVCASCFTRCVCGKPLGPCHAVTVRDPNGKTVSLCPSCAGAQRRLTVMQRLLSPFFRFKG